MPVELSVVVPTFRRPDELKIALASVLRQSGTSLEVIVVDDSPEGSAEAAVKEVADSRVSYIKNPKPTGGRPSVVRNLGFSKASGALIHFLDDDDIVPDGHYEAVKAAFAESPDVGVVFGRIEPFGDDPALVGHESAYFSRAARRARRCRWFGPKLGFSAHMLFHQSIITCSAAVIRRDCVEAVGGFDPDVPINEDLDFYARAIRRFGARFLDRVVLHYRIGRNSLARNPHVDAQLQQSYVRIQEKYRREWGWADFLVTKTLARIVFRML
ncbi:MAG: glycosyltransferase family 2 protein [Acidobacteriota bacterium]